MLCPRWRAGVSSLEKRRPAEGGTGFPRLMRGVRVAVNRFAQMAESDIMSQSPNQYRKTGAVCRAVTGVRSVTRDEFPRELR